MINFFRFFFFLAFLSPLSLIAEVKTSISSQGELQEKYIETQYEDGNDSSSVHLGYANTELKIEIGERRTIELNWLLRYSNSELYEDNQTPLYFLNYPTNTIARNMFKLRHTNEGKYSVTESTLNKFSYRWGDAESSVTIGRMFINYGEGLTFNPINPFNYSSSFSSIENIQQGNDGVKVTLLMERELVLNLFLFGNQDLEESNEEITRTIFLDADYTYTPKSHFHYIIGEDEKRHTLGMEYRYSFEDGLFFIQAVAQSERLDKKENSESMQHAILGFEKDISDSWVSRIEMGRQDLDEKANYGWRNQNFLPVDYFVSLINQYRFNERAFIRVNFTTDPNTKFQYLFAEHHYKLSKHLESRLFYGKTLHLDAQHEDAVTQGQMPMELGLGLGFIF